MTLHVAMRSPFFLDAITCPIGIERTDDMITFNHQYYNRQCFDRHERPEASHNHRYGTFRYPRTGWDFDAHTVIQKYYITRPTHAKLVELVKHCIPSVRTEQIY